LQQRLIKAARHQARHLWRQHLDHKYGNRQEDHGQRQQQTQQTPQFGLAFAGSHFAEHRHQRGVDESTDQQVIQLRRQNRRHVVRTDRAGGAEQVALDDLTHQAQDTAEHIAEGDNTGRARDAGIHRGMPELRERLGLERDRIRRSIGGRNQNGSIGRW